jgi:hypoxanthine phosphoribosyltransferase
LLKRKDTRRIPERHGEAIQDDLMDKRILIPRHEIQSKVKELAGRISSDYAGREPMLIGILKGVVFFFAELAMSLSIPAKIDFIRASSYGSSKASCGAIKLVKDVELPVKGQDLIIVEDIVDTGLTLSYLVSNLKSREPASVKICALIDKLERREQEVAVDYCGFKVQKGFIVGYGLDYAEQYRNLPDIWVLNE